MRRLLPLLLLLLASLPACAAAPPAPDPGEPENFLWVFGQLYRSPELYENLLAFAERHDLAIIMAPASVSHTPEELEEIRHAMEQARDRGIAVLYNTGVFREQDGWPTGDVILGEEEWRQRYTEALQRVTRPYLELFPGGRVIVGHEDPLFSNWPHRDEDNYREHGAEMFMLQRAAVKALDPEARVGMFVLPSYVLEMYEAHMPVLKAEGALPDFNMIDKYRGYGDARAGIEATNAETRELLAGARRMSEGAPIYYLGQDHTINTGYTPSRDAISDNIDAVLETGAEGVGWYIRTRYVPTEEVSTLGGTVEPFLPLSGEVDEERYNTFTGDRDRFMFAYLSTFERQGLLEPEERLDLWIHGDDLDLHEARLFLRDRDGEWRFIGDLGTYVGGDNPYTLDGRTGAVIFHALERDAFLGAGGSAGLEARIVARDSEDGLTIRGIYALPYTPADRYVTEGEAGAMLAADPGAVAERSLAHAVWPEGRALERGDTLTVEAR